MQDFPLAATEIVDIIISFLPDEIPFKQDVDWKRM